MTVSLRQYRPAALIRAFAALGRVFLVSLVFVTGLLAANSGPAIGATRARGLRLQRPTKKVVIEFGPVEKGKREGSFTLLLRNPDRVALRPRITLDPSKTGPVLRLHLFQRAEKAPDRHTSGPQRQKSGQRYARQPPKAPPQALPSLQSSGAVPTISPGAIGRVAVLVDLPASSDPSSLNGALVLRSVRRSYKLRGPPVLLRFQSAGLDLSDVKVVPPTVSLHTTTWLPWGTSASGSVAEFNLRGIGSKSLLSANEPVIDGRAVLHADNGHSITVETFIKAGHSAALQPAIRVVGRPQAGTYTGVLPISSSAESPTIKVSVLARVGIAWALGAVALGTVLGGLLPLLGARARRRDLLRARLQSMLIDYFAVERKDAIMRWEDLEEAIGADRQPWKATEWKAEPDLHGAAGLFSSIAWAQDDDNFKEVTTKVDLLAERIASWLRIQPKAERLNELLSGPQPRDIDEHSWADTCTVNDSRALFFEVVRTEPPTPAEATKQTRAIRRQTEWQCEVEAAWEQFASSEDIDPEAFSSLLTQLLAIGAPNTIKAPAVRSGAEWLQLEKTLAGLLLAFAKVRPGGVLDVEPRRAEALEKYPVPIEEPAHPWATRLLDAVKAGGATLWRITPDSTKPVKLILAAQRRDRVLSAIAAAGAILVYVLQLYTDTWGSLTDFLTAIAAGFGAQAIVRWGALPIFQSWATKTTPTSEEPLPEHL